MTITVQAQDHSRNDHGCWSKATIKEVLDILFSGSAVYYLDPDGDERIEREYVEECHRADGTAVFYNDEGERLIIT